MAFRKRILLALLFCFLSHFSKAQFVTIPDTNFVNWLNSHGYSSCLTGNQLDTTCNLIITVNYIYITFSDIEDLTGISYFDNLDTLFCRESKVNFIPALPPNLKKLDCPDSELSSLPTLPSSLIILNCDNNHITSLPTLPSSLQTLVCDFNPIMSLPILPNSLSLLSCAGCQLTSIPTLPNSLDKLNCSINQLTALPLLPATLTSLNCGQNQISALPVLPSNFIELDCSYNQIVSLPLLPATLEFLYCDSNFLSSIGPLPNTLKELSCVKNQLSTIPNLGSNLLYFYCDFNLISSIPPLPASLMGLSCSNNFLTSLPVLPIGMTAIACGYNQLVNLPLLPDSLIYFNCEFNNISNLPVLPSKLNEVICNNNQISFLPALPSYLDKLDIRNNLGIACLPPLGFVFFLYWGNTSIDCLPNVITVIDAIPSIDSVPICNIINLNSCPIYWNIKGRVFSDSNSNCLLDTNENLLYPLKLNLFDNGNLVQQTLTNSLGEYTFDVDPGIYTYSMDTVNTFFIATCPAIGSYTSNILMPSTYEVDKDFSLICKPGFDLQVSSVLLSQGALRPGNSSQISVLSGDLSHMQGLVCNAGVGGTVKVVLNGPVSYWNHVFGSLIPIVIGDTLTYSIPDFSLVNFYTDFRFFVQTDTLAQLGDTVCFTVFVTPISGDYNPSNNYYSHCFTVVNSHDPNDKQVSPSGLTDTSLYDLTYTVRFQNTGNAPAQHIYVLDTLDQNIDESTFQLLAYSHEPQMQIIGKRVRFNFPNINLPDSVNNEPESHGFVQYRVKRKNNLPIGTQIHNTAYIYFDFNPPVQTNTTVNEIAVTSGVGVGEIQNPISFSIFPNPIASGQIQNIYFNSSEKKKAELSVYDLSGRKLYDQFVNASEQNQQIALPNLSTGIYVVVVNDGIHTMQQKLVVLKEH